MSKRKWSSKNEKEIKEGRGSGIGSEYKSWLKIQDVSLLGRSIHLKGIQMSREHEAWKLLLGIQYHECGLILQLTAIEKCSNMRLTDLVNQFQGCFPNNKVLTIQYSRIIDAFFVTSRADYK